MRFFTRGGLYRHEFTLDVDLYVEHAFTVHDRTKLRIIWIHRKYGYRIVEDFVEVQHKDLPRWKRVA